MDFDDPRWLSLNGGYRIPYDPRPALRRLKHASDDAGAWEELVEELHHQGDVGEASYATVASLIDHIDRGRPLHWMGFALVSMIETARQNPYADRSGSLNPPVPEWLKEKYFQSLDGFLHLALRDFMASDALCRTAILSLMLACSQRPLLADLCSWDDRDIAETLRIG